MAAASATFRDCARASGERVSSWDRTGGNDDRLHIAPGQEAVLADIAGAGVVRHIWVTIACDEPDFLRKVVLRACWDGEASRPIDVPVGDFFGIGHAQTRNFASLPLQMSPEDGKGFNCWFPMPFAPARASRSPPRASARARGAASTTTSTTRSSTRSPTGSAASTPSGAARTPPTASSDEGVDERGVPSSGAPTPTGDGNYVILDAAAAATTSAATSTSTTCADAPSGTGTARATT